MIGTVESEMVEQKDNVHKHMSKVIQTTTEMNVNIQTNIDKLKQTLNSKFN
jgi:SMC interacting uncharacterized protein involved in chromosome segregation